MRSYWVKEPLKYDGSQLHSHFAYQNYGLVGDSIAGFAGPVEVRISEMVDLEDVLANAPISSDEMLSFIVETFGMQLSGMVCLQRLLAATIAEEINLRLGALSVIRRGDDLFFDDRKLSVSIATLSPVSALIHLALNIRSTGAPIAISCLNEMKIDPKELADAVMNRFCAEYESIRIATMKVRGVV